MSVDILAEAMIAVLVERLDRLHADGIHAYLSDDGTLRLSTFAPFIVDGITYRRGTVNCARRMIDLVDEDHPHVDTTHVWGGAARMDYSRPPMTDDEIDECLGIGKHRTFARPAHDEVTA